MELDTVHKARAFRVAVLPIFVNPGGNFEKYFSPAMLLDKTYRRTGVKPKEGAALF